MIKWFANLDMTITGVIGIYISMVPAIYCGIKILDSGVGEFVGFWSVYCMFMTPTALLMLLNKILNSNKEAGEID